MQKGFMRWLDPILIIGLIISILIGVGMVLTGNDSILGLLVGLLSTIITLDLLQKSITEIKLKIVDCRNQVETQTKTFASIAISFTQDAKYF